MKEYCLIYECKQTKREVKARILIGQHYMIQDPETLTEQRLTHYGMRKNFRFLRDTRKPIGLQLTGFKKAKKANGI